MYMSELADEMKAARQDLAPLIEESRAAVGDTAMRLFKALQEVPAATNYPMDLPPSGGVPYGFNLQRGRRQVRQAAVDDTRRDIRDIRDPLLHPIEGYRDVSAVCATTEFYRTYYSRDSATLLKLFGTNHFPLPNRPGYTRHVSLGLHHPDRNPSYGYIPASISSKGGLGRGHLDSVTTDYRSFDDPEHLVRAHSVDYKGRLAMAGLVAHGVGLVYAIESELSGLEALHADWRKIGPELDCATDQPFWAQQHESWFDAHIIDTSIHPS